VTVTGTGLTAATQVHFGSAEALDLSVASDTQLTVTSPLAAASGAADVTVTTPAGTSATSAAGQFTYLAAGLMFLSWYRTGLGAAVQAPSTGAPLDTAPPAAVTATVDVKVGDPDNPGDTTAGKSATGTLQVRLHAPGDVTGLDTAQIIRTYPTPGAANVPPDSFPLIEFAHPNVPWLLSPTGPQANKPSDTDPRRGLTPWLCLVVVPEPPATLAPPATPGGLPTLTVTDAELPEVPAARLWAHTQWMTLASDDPAQALPALISQHGERVLSRLLAPRYLQPNTPYLACVVPTFASPKNGAATLSPAWQHSTPPTTVPLPVYYSWRFSTGAEGDFLSLVKRLKRWDQGGVGIRPLDVGDAGAGMPSPPSGQGPWLISLEGALVSADVAIGSWGALSDHSGVEGQIQQALADRLNGKPGELTPPVYGATQASFRGQLSTAAAPVVMGVSPASGSGDGGNRVTVTGSGFAGATAVGFGPAAASGLSVANDTELTVTSPRAAASGTVDVTVTTPAGTSPTSAAGQFTYRAAGQAPVVTGVSPASGWVSGNDPVTVTGSGFAGATVVGFGPAAASGLSVANDTELTVTSPAAAASGTVDVTVTTPAGISPASAGGQFTYRAAGQAPVVTGVSPASGWVSGNDPVTVTGSGFAGATRVGFGPAAASGLSVANDTELTVTSPPAAASGTVDVTVTTPAGTSHASAVGQFTYRGAGPEPVWLRTLNLDPRYRAAASLGADLVRANQEALALSAWDQAGQARTANQVLRQGQMARELGQSTYARRIGGPGISSPPMDDDRLLQVTRAVHSQIPAPASATAGSSGQVSVADVVAGKPAVAAALSVPFRRLASPAGPVASRLTTAPLPSPVTGLDTGKITPTPPVSPVSGLVTLTDLAHPSGNTETPDAQIAGITLGGLHGGPVTQPGLWWEQVSPAVGDILLQPGWLSDLWVVGSKLGRAMDWDGTVLQDWADPPADFRAATGVAPGPVVAPGSAGDWYAWYGNQGIPDGGGASLISWGPWPALGGRVWVGEQLSAVAVAKARIEPAEYPMTGYLVSVACELRGDLIPADPNNEVKVQPDATGAWPSATVFSGQAPGQGGNPLTLAAAIGTADLTGTGNPSIAVVWSPNPAVMAYNSAGVLEPVTGPQVSVLVDVDVTCKPAKTITAPVSASGDVQAAALANRRLYVLIGGQLWSAAVDAAGGTIGSFTSHDWFTQYAPPGWVWATVTAADFSGSGSADLLFFYGIAQPGVDGTTAYRAAYRIGYEPDASGHPAYWGEVLGADTPVTDSQASLVLGPVDPNTTAAVRQPAAQAFRTAAGGTQGRMNAVIPPPPASSPPPPKPIVADLAGAVRAGVDPQTTVPRSVTGRLALPADPGDAGGDVLQPLAFTPYFPQPFFETVRDSALPRLIPGLSSFPDEAITVLGADPKVIEAILAGANQELSRELLWRGVPALHTATFFARFWDRRDAAGTPLPDITGISSWAASSDLGSHSSAAAGELAVLAWRGGLVRCFPHATIYAAPAVLPHGASKRTIDLDQRIDPLFSGSLGGDSAFAGFPFTIQDAMSGGPGSQGMYFVFQEHPTAPRFGLNLVGDPASYGTVPATWSQLDWSATVPDQASYEALTYLDASQASPLWKASLPDTGAAGATSHQWGFSAAHMAYITYQPPALIARHAEDLLAPPSTGGA
jgi:hypothetical protein